jgi:hypothetical protein
LMALRLIIDEKSLDSRQPITGVAQPCTST